MELTPNKIHEEYRKNNIDKYTANKLLISLIENSEVNQIRIESLKILEEIGIYDNYFYKLLENLLISDSNSRIRIRAANLLKSAFLEKTLTPMKWAIQHENDIDCLNIIINTLVFIGNSESKSILINEVKKIRKEKYLDKNRRINNRKFKKSIKALLKKRDYRSISHQKLADIIINYKIIEILTIQFYSVYFEIENVLVTNLDLADVEYEVRGWKSDFKNNIREISQIVGLKYLKQLKNLNVSNNLIYNIKDLLEVESITHLFISNNRISDIQNLEYIKNMPNLIFLDISGNEVAAKLNKQDFKALEVMIRKVNY